MTLEHHTLDHEFPEHRHIIARLREQDSTFRALADEYAEVDDEIYRIEQQIEAASDQLATELKRRRVVLKDRIAQLVEQAGAASA
jgi:uncharacterized protein YdcH (DUF465 family)